MRSSTNGRLRYGRETFDGVLAHHSTDMVFFDVPKGSESQGIEAYRRSWTDGFFAWLGKRGTFQLENFDAVVGDDVAVCFGKLRCRGTAEPKDLSVRLTVGLRKREGAWEIVHEHHSVPSG